MQTKSKYLFILPNLFTLGSLFAGFYAISLVSTNPTSESTYLSACFALLIACLCDMLDGRIARLTGTQSDFGMHMDSLVDVVSFGVAPAFLIYHWVLVKLGWLGLLVSFTYAACGAIRLARFNVMESKATKTAPSKYFQGLPIPLAAGVMISSLMLMSTLGGLTDASFSTPTMAVVSLTVGLTLFTSYLMVSNIHFRTFKDLRFSPSTFAVLFAVLGLIILGGIISNNLAGGLVVGFGIYLLNGFVGNIFRKRLHASL